MLLSAHCDTSEQIDRAKAILKQTVATDIASAGEETVGPRPPIVTPHVSSDRQGGLVAPLFFNTFNTLLFR